MPPRRSCFAGSRFPAGPRSIVSMPQRRSCFLLVLDVPIPKVEGFNATTAFLLRSGSAGPGCWRSRVSMPPRRSCFHRNTQSIHPLAPVSMPPRRSCFGVLATLATWLVPGFNATTAFLLRVLPPSRRHLVLKFQCHHGVPASALQTLDDLDDLSGFNATTAFLLLARGRIRIRIRARFQCHHGVPASRGRRGASGEGFLVSMPPRRSCFDPGPNAHTWLLLVSMPPRRSCFYLHRRPRSRPHGLVSMPPRRSCFVGWAGAGGGAGPQFQCHHGVPASRSRHERLRLGHPRFNATTAFLLLRSRRSGARAQARFQCHHGVPASDDAPPDACPIHAGFNATTAFLLRGWCCSPRYGLI